MVKLVVDSEEYYSVDEAAEALHKSVPTVWRMIADKRLSSVKVGDRRLIPKKEVDGKKEVSGEPRRGSPS